MKKASCILSAVALFLNLTMIQIPSAALAADNEKGAIDLKFAYWVPPVATPAQKIYLPWAQEIENKTNKRVKITSYGGEALGKAPDHYNLCRMGLADIVLIEPTFTPGVFPLMEVMHLPMLFQSAEEASFVMWNLFEKYMKDSEFKDVKVLIAHTTGITQLFSRNKQVKTLEDLRGIKFATTSTLGMKTIKALGGSPLMMPEPEIYTSLERGLIEGRFIEWEGAWVFKINEVTKYRTANINLDTNTLMVLMNKKVWKNLPDDIKVIIDEVSGLNVSRAAGKAFDEADKIFFDKSVAYDKKANNPPVYYLPDSERQKWEEAIKITKEEWIKEKSKKGLPAQDLVNDLDHFIEVYRSTIQAD